MFPPIPIIRKKHIVKKLQDCGAFSPETAVTFTEAGVINPNYFKRITDLLIRRGTITAVNGRYFLNTDPAQRGRMDEM